MSSVDPANAGSERYLADLEQIADQDECPFCRDSTNFLATHNQPILFETGHWFLTRAEYPYEGTEYHYIVVLKAHKTRLLELTTFEWQGLMTMIDQVGNKSGALAIRYGNPELTGATVSHLHAHILIPLIDPTTGRGKTVQFGIGDKSTPS